MEKVFGKCGFECGRCPAFKANSQTDADRKRGAGIWDRYFGLHFKPEVLACQGCQGEKPWKGGSLLPDRSCPIRACAVYNNVQTCAQCASFPCKEYSHRVPGPGLRKEREEAAGINISDVEWAQYLEQYDGQTHLAVLHATLAPNALVAQKEFDTGAAAPFPTKTSLGVQRQHKMKLLHSVLSKNFSRRGETYAEQVLIERKRPYVACLLWVMGLYGGLEDGRLVLNSTDHPDRKECVRLVRKTDNAPHKSAQDAMTSLADSGIRIECQTFKRRWTLTMSIDENVGGKALLSTLKEYEAALVEKYGVPDYVSGYNLKGQAFKAFSRVDMAVFQP